MNLDNSLRIHGQEENRIVRRQSWRVVLPWMFHVIRTERIG